MPDSSDTEIEAVVEEYFRGMYEGDVERLKRIFHPESWLYGERKGKKSAFPVSGFFEYVDHVPVPGDVGEAYEMSIKSIDRAGPIAVVRVEDLYQGAHYTDFLTLMETDDGWRIVNKAYHSED